MSSKILIGSIVATVVLFTGCANKAAGIADSQASKTTSAKESGASASASNSASSVAAKVEQAQGKLQAIFFDFDKYSIKADMHATVESNAKISNDAALSGIKIKLEGNADERGTDEYNYALALKRAEAVKTGYIANGVAANRISAVSLGEGNPVCKESTEECWSKNRRVDSKLDK